MKGSKPKPKPFEYWGQRKPGKPAPNPRIFIREGGYGPDEIAALLLLAVGGNRQQARKILLSLPEAAAPRADETAMYLAAYSHQQTMQLKGKRCTDHTALKKIWGGKARSLWDKLKAKDQTLKEITEPFRQAAKLVKTPPKDS